MSLLLVALRQMLSMERRMQAVSSWVQQVCLGHKIYFLGLRLIYSDKAFQCTDERISGKVTCFSDGNVSVYVFNTLSRATNVYYVGFNLHCFSFGFPLLSKLLGLFVSNVIRITCVSVLQD